MRSVFEGGFEFLRPSVRGTPTTHSEGLLLRVGAIQCAPTYNRGVVQHVVFNRLGLAQPHECSSKAATCHVNSTLLFCASGLQQHLIICTEDVTAVHARCKGYFLGTRLRLSRRVTLEQVPTDIFFLCLRRRYLPPRPSPLQLDIRWEFKPFSNKRFLIVRKL